jgi:uncharacterized protein (DUF2062 family)
MARVWGLGDLRRERGFSGEQDTGLRVLSLRKVIATLSLPRVSADKPTQRPRSSIEAFWQRRVIEPIVAQLTQGISPEKIALTLAVGFACAVFPIPGTTMLLCLLVGIVLRLNLLAIQGVNLLCWPIHAPLIYIYWRLGQRIFSDYYQGHRSMRVLSEELWDNPVQTFERFGSMIFHAIVAWAIIMAVCIPLIYGFTLPILREFGQRRSAADHPVP